jgi:hypothetical protein
MNIRIIPDQLKSDLPKSPHPVHCSFDVLIDTYLPVRHRLLLPPPPASQTTTAAHFCLIRNRTVTQFRLQPSIPSMDSGPTSEYPPAALSPFDPNGDPESEGCTVAAPSPAAFSPAGHCGYPPCPHPMSAAPKRLRRPPHEIERLYTCGWQGCEKAYGSLSHLNNHVRIKEHGARRFPHGMPTLP